MKTILVGFIFKSLFLFTEQLPETKELVIFMGGSVRAA